LLFNSYVFLLLFLPSTWILFRIASIFRGIDAAVTLLMLASLFFYSYWNPPFVFLILFSIIFNYSWGRLIGESFVEDALKRRSCLYIGMAVNLLLIAYFKYTNFLLSNIALIGGWHWTNKEIFLPLGISFFTFQQIAYLIDCFKNSMYKNYTFTQYALFVSFFPQLIAGPIVRYEQIMPQLVRLRTFGFSYKNMVMGISLLSLGLLKKLFIADTLALWVTPVFDGSHSVTLFEAWGGTLCYAFQIYFDFSGYSDMALGLGRLFNIELPLNFNSPYKAFSISDFWKRWHISLSTFLKDYLYIPLGGSHNGKVRRYVNLMITMLLGGLWHGASWNFVAWGALHGLYLCIHHGFRSLFPRIRIPSFWGRSITFSAVVLAWIPFRAPSLSRAMEIFEGILGNNGSFLPPHWIPVSFLQELAQKMGIEVVFMPDWAFSGPRREHLTILFVLFIAAVLSFFFPNSYDFVRHSKSNTVFRVLAFLLVVAVFFIGRESEFLYFQF
jgi:alginate O-acetyltransferase complex protein AlgI